jgi:nucleotidyltransferase/DNA polymerase involved in DNA repair
MVEELVERLVNERMVEVYDDLKDKMQRNFEELVEQLEKRGGIDEKAVKALVKVLVGKELERFRGEIEERLSSLGLDGETINQVINEVVNKLLSDLDRRFMHLASVIDERFGEVRDLLDLTSEILRAEVETEETLSELRNLLDEEHLEELIYRVLVRKGVLKRRRRKWVPLIVGLGILAAIVTGLLLSPIVTLVILFIVFVVLMRW